MEVAELGGDEVIIGALVKERHRLFDMGRARATWGASLGRPSIGTPNSVSEK